MPIILTSESPSNAAEFVSYLDITAPLSVPAILDANIESSLLIVAPLEGGVGLETFTSTLSITASLGTIHNLAANVAIELEIVEPQLFIPNNAEFFLNLIVDILPASVPNQRWLPRMKVDGVEIPVISGVYNEPAEAAGADLQVTLARLSDKSLMTPGASVEFGIGRKIAGAWDEGTFLTLLDDGVIDGTSHSIGWEGNQPTDSFTVRTVSNFTEQLLKTPETDLVIYDSSRQTINADDFEPLVDTEGREYAVALQPVSGLTLYDLFQEIFVERCGFAGYRTNIPDFGLSRVDCPIGTPLLESIKGHFGQFEPVIFESGGEVWIVDTTIVLPSGFPSPRTIGVNWYETLGVDNRRSRLDGLIVIYTEDARAFDYVTSRTETKTESTGTFGQPDYTTTFIQRLYRQYRKLSNPGAVIREELYHEERLTSDSFQPIYESREDFDFDGQGRFTSRTKTVQQLVPDVENPGSTIFATVAEENEDLTYAAHPFQTRSQYVQRRDVLISGLIVTDADNQQLGEDFERDYVTVYRSGNLVEGQTTRFGAIKTISETARPQRNGQVKIKVLEVDHLTNAVTTDTNEDRTGDVSINGLSPTQNRILVFDDENATRTRDRLETLHAGEMPLDLAIPWARRNLRSRKTKARDGRANVLGYDDGLRKGTPVTLTGRTPIGQSLETIGSFLIIGRSVPFGADGVSMNLICKEI